MLMDDKYTPKPLTMGHVNRAQSFHVTFPTDTVSSASLREEPLLLPVLLSPLPFWRRMFVARLIARGAKEEG